MWYGNPSPAGAHRQQGVQAGPHLVDNGQGTSAVHVFLAEAARDCGRKSLSDSPLEYCACATTRS